MDRRRSGGTRPGRCLCYNLGPMRNPAVLIEPAGSPDRLINTIATIAQCPGFSRYGRIIHLHHKRQNYAKLLRVINGAERRFGFHCFATYNEGDDSVHFVTQALMFQHCPLIIIDESKLADYEITASYMKQYEIIEGLDFPDEIPG